MLAQRGHMVEDAPWSQSFDIAIRSNGFGHLVLKGAHLAHERALSPLDHGSLNHSIRSRVFA
jgi:hypothetical protein